MVVLNGYLFLNIFVGWITLEAERKQIAPPNWIRFFIYLSVPWAVSIHTVTAFLYAGLPGRGYWLTAVLAARFLASAFTVPFFTSSSSKVFMAVGFEIFLLFIISSIVK